MAICHRGGVIVKKLRLMPIRDFECCFIFTLLNKDKDNLGIYKNNKDKDNLDTYKIKIISIFIK
jgi:hypothetical protein